MAKLDNNQDLRKMGTKPPNMAYGKILDPLSDFSLPEGVIRSEVPPKIGVGRRFSPDMGVGNQPTYCPM